jgi:hypothetical protein
MLIAPATRLAIQFLKAMKTLLPTLILLACMATFSTALAQKPGQNPPPTGRLDQYGLAASIDAAMRTGDAIRFEQLTAEFLGAGKHNALEYMNMQRRFTELWGDQRGFVRRTQLMVNRYGAGDPSLLNNAAWHTYEIVDDRQSLRTALDWAEESIFLSPAYYNYDTYAMIAAKIGQRRQAIIFARTAIMLARMEGQDCRETEMVLNSLTCGRP